MKREMSQLRWQCRRGMRELDVLLTRYLDGRYEDAPQAEKAAFRTILEFSDPELIGYLLRGESSGQALVDKVLADLRR